MGRNMKTKRTLILLAAGGLLAATGLAAGCHRGPGGHHRDPAKVAELITERVDDALDDLDATPAQRENIRAIKDRLLAEGAKAHGDRKALHAELLAMWNADAVDRARLHAIVDERIDAMRAFAHAAADGVADAHDVLTPEQRAKVAKKAERRME
jgi:Spy/CpxP family protein refolding chaperone